jgi:hypothetical protein
MIQPRLCEQTADQSPRPLHGFCSELRGKLVGHWGQEAQSIMIAWEKGGALYHFMGKPLTLLRLLIRQGAPSSTSSP